MCGCIDNIPMHAAWVRILSMVAANVICATNTIIDQGTANFHTIQVCLSDFITSKETTDQYADNG